MPEEQGGGKIRWVLVGWMFVIASIIFVDRVNISVAGKDIITQFHLTNVQLGSVSSAFLLGYALFQVPNGRLADAWGPRRVLTIGLIWWASFAALTGSVPAGLRGGLLLFIVIRFFLGAGEAVVFPACNRVVARWIPISERGLANGIIFAGVGFGAGVTPPLVTAIMLNWGWRWSFWLSAIGGGLAAVVWYLLVRDEPEQHPWLGAKEKQWIRAGTEGAIKKLDLPWRRALESREVLALSLSYFTFGYAAYIFFAWFFLYLVNTRGLNLKSSAFYSMLPFLSMTAGSLIGGVINDITTRRFGQRFGRAGIATIGMLLAGLFIAFGSHAQSARVASVILAGGAGALYLAQSSFFSASADVGGHFAGSISGLMNMACQIGGVITASLTPWIAGHYGWNASFGVAAALCAIGAAAWLAVDPRRTLLVSTDLAATREQNISSVGAK
ncbi:MAG TPA: MFS transporter [Candidatus Aquilonibacter sp.]|nr:MFS transporter [Candidatus Aquilonibacter sp.]